MTKNTPWQTVLNSNSRSKFPVAKKNLVLPEDRMSKKPSYYTSIGQTAIEPKRYSFDDNGGGYMGL
jgi:hypothetical protein